MSSIYLSSKLYMFDMINVFSCGMYTVSCNDRVKGWYQQKALTSKMCLHFILSNVEILIYQYHIEKYEYNLTLDKLKCKHTYMFS